MTNPLRQAVDEQLEKGIPDDERETIDNKERGCGHLKPNAAYVRCDVSALSAPDGDIPRFVELDDPVEYKEYTGKGAIIPGYRPFPGNAFSLHYIADGGTTTPSDDIPNHIDRLSRFGFDGSHFGDITSTRAIDLLMSVGKSNWETPEDYIDECRERGLNLRIPVSSKQQPPVIEPLRTRVWIIHPHGAGENRPAIIGYSYLTRCVFTTGTRATPDDPDCPQWAVDFAKTGRLDIVDRGEPISDDDATAKAHKALSDFDGDTGDDTTDDGDGGDDASDDPDAGTDDAVDGTDFDTATVTVADDDGHGDVSGLTVQFGRDDIDRQVRRQSFDAAVDGVLNYNALKVIASNRDEVDAGATPDTDDLIDAIVDDATGVVPAYHDQNDTDDN